MAFNKDKFIELAVEGIRKEFSFGFDTAVKIAVILEEAFEMEAGWQDLKQEEMQAEAEEVLAGDSHDDFRPTGEEGEEIL